MSDQSHPTSRRPIRLVVVDDHPVFRLGMVALLGSIDGFEVAGQAASREQALEKIEGVRHIIWAEKKELQQYLIDGDEGIDLRPALFRACATSGWSVLELAYERISLEEAFAILTAARGPGAAAP